MLFTDAGFVTDAPVDLSLCSRLVEENDYYKVIVDYDYRSDYNRLFCRYLETHHQLKKSIVIQAITDEDIASKVYEQGGNIINKPYDTEELLFAVKRL
jgi:DNA-binding response OmpR family regulator